MLGIGLGLIKSIRNIASSLVNLIIYEDENNDEYEDENGNFYTEN